ncbi:MerR family transcriptional regulator [Nocardia cyriacigeorgica]|uniref:MerR family transcriptional regulator n=1 Tax=Nocardia cyriacigeorgica TaxID=135487 RepID=UPI0024584F84|nr:MerR family transcriptional regulator [Nocardia cyriacigeorgica]
MLIGELSRRCGVSTRALRHYEEAGLLVPNRDGNGYRRYGADAADTVERIRRMIAAGLGTTTIRRYLECVRTGAHGIELQMCPALRAELDAIGERLDRQATELDHKRRKLAELADSAG